MAKSPVLMPRNANLGNANFADAYLGDANLAPRRALGQNFLTDPQIAARIAAAGGDLSGYDVIEVGPGSGRLTRALLASAARRIIAVEKDPRFMPLLNALEPKPHGRLWPRCADALLLSLEDLGQAPRVVIANLPYNIATALWLRWLSALRTNPRLCSRFVLMFQREVAQRITAPTGQARYGRLSVLSQWLCQAQFLFTVPPGAFFPRPRVHSGVVLLTPRPNPLAVDAEVLARVLRLAFGGRRKMLRRSLAPVITPEGLAGLGIDPCRRAQTLSVREFVTLARAVTK